MEDKELGVELLDMLESFCAMQSPKIEPEGDWHTQAALVRKTKTGSLELGLFSICFEDDLEKEIVFSQVLPNAVATYGSPVVGLVLPVWTAPVGADGARPSRHPEREERLMLVALTSSSIEIRSAPVIRRQSQPPELGEWSLLGREEGRFSGLTVDATRRALRAVRASWN